MTGFSSARITPWVARLIAIQVCGFVLLKTVFFAAAFSQALAFDPAAIALKPWSLVTYLLVHNGLLHLAVTILLLVVFGPRVEELLGGWRFLGFYLMAGVSAAIIAAGLQPFMDLPPLAGAGGSVLGVALLFALHRPGDEVLLFPMPVPLGAPIIVAILIVLNLLGSLGFSEGSLAHPGFFGGLIAAWLWFQFHNRFEPRPLVTTRTAPQPVMATQLHFQHEERGESNPPPLPPPQLPAVAVESKPSAKENEQAEMNRVLDKISSEGISSLTSAERKFLEEVSLRQKSQAN